MVSKRSASYLDASTYPTLTQAFEAARTVQHTTGATVYLPGGVYDGDGLRVPHNTRVVGDGRLSKIGGTMVVSSIWGNTFQDVHLQDGIDMVDARSCLFQRVWFGDKVTMSGATYYNMFHACAWVRDAGIGVVNMIEVKDECNDNHVEGSRVSHTGTALKFSDIAHNWTVRGTAFEGAPNAANQIGPALEIKGEDHVVDGCRFERGNNNRWHPATIVLETSTKRCRILGGTRSYSFSIRDHGQHNHIH